VPALRRLLAHRHLAALLCAATLLLRLLVPGGYMIAVDHGRVTIELCSGVAPQPMTMGGAAMHGDMPDHHRSKDHGKAEMPCAFAGLSAASLGAVDPILLVALVAFVMTIGRGPTVVPTIVRQAHLRPPLRAPPAFL